MEGDPQVSCHLRPRKSYSVWGNKVSRERSKVWGKWGHSLAKKNEAKERKEDATIIGDLESPAHDTISVQSYSRSPQESESPRPPGVEVQHQQQNNCGATEVKSHRGEREQQNPTCAHQRHSSWVAISTSPGKWPTQCWAALDLSLIRLDPAQGQKRRRNRR